MLSGRWQQSFTRIYVVRGRHGSSSVKEKEMISEKDMNCGDVITKPVAETFYHFAILIVTIRMLKNEVLINWAELWIVLPTQKF